MESKLHEVSIGFQEVLEGFVNVSTSFVRKKTNETQIEIKFHEVSKIRANFL